ncbi:tail fiber domain-containing protein [Spartinivicinus poritis]|uniref:Tail fiber domain-containing protein n=1 Tax=Spartinivicinus poritis TaxID=2994640 RepID=A0ABT5UKA0_9GAMM|nr:tail fiber domain-containing protein [Spartinivicinus sp. A2-2]MDE1465464.1 tail fiber domain-containing protein [Spartinivicinus sp. A2-2]
MKKLTITIILSFVSTFSHAYQNTHEHCKDLSGDDYWGCRYGYQNEFIRFSDQNLKKNSVKVSNPLEKVTLLNGVTFEWKSPSETDIEHLPQGKDIGVIAQDVEKVFPELVHNITVTNKNATEATLKQVNYAGLVGVLIEAVKELKKENEALRQQLGL